MCASKAKKLFREINTASAPTNRTQYVNYLAAIVKLFPDEVDQTCADGRKLRHVLQAAAEPARIEFLFNFSRFCTDAMCAAISLSLSLSLYIWLKGHKRTAPLQAGGVGFN